MFQVHNGLVGKGDTWYDDIYAPIHHTAHAIPTYPLRTILTAAAGERSTASYIFYAVAAKSFTQIRQ